MGRIALIAGTLAVILCLGTVTTAAELDVTELVRRVETQYSGDSSYAVMTMTIVTESWTREYSLESWSEGRDKFLITVLSPAKDEGFATLKVSDDMWNYLPRIDRLMKIPSSLMGDGWMGSNITNDDLVKENKIEELYELTLLEVTADSVAVVRCTPRPDAAVVWGGIEYQIDLERLVPVIVKYFDEDDELVRTMSFGDVTNLEGRWIPMSLTVQPQDKPNEHTAILYETLKFNPSMSADLFTVNHLRRQ